MPINFTTGTINEPDTGSVGLSMMEQIRDDLVAHPAWELVEEFTPSSSAVRWYVFKCLSAESGLPSDFYVIFSRTLANGVLRMFICEDYTTGTHTATHYARTGYFETVAYDELGRQSTEYVLAGTELGSTNAHPQHYFWSPSGTSTKWWIIAGDDYFAIAFNGTSNGWFNVGVYTPLADGFAFDMPFQAQGSAGAGGSYGSITRNPAAADISTRGSALYFSADAALGFAADLRYNDKLQGGQRPVAEIGMRIYEYDTGERLYYGSVLGKLQRLRTSNGQVPGGMAFGDAYVLQDKLWVPFAPGDGRMWDTGVPSS